jgi:GTP-binding protein YchF
MDIALCGLPRAGKSTLWEILTRTHTHHEAGRPEAHRGVARVPDDRLDKIAAHFKPKKTTHATVTYVDLAPVERGLGKVDSPILTALRTADALLLVIRLWDDPADPHPEGSIDPARDLSLIETEFLLADMEVAQRRIDRLEGLIRKGAKEADKKEHELLHRALATLEAEKPLRAAGLRAEELKMLRGYAFLTAKPLLVTVNLPDDRMADLAAPPSAFGLGELTNRPGCDFAVLSARIEEEIADLAPDDAAAFREELGIREPALDRLIRASYRLMGQISFFTMNDECRAWPLRDGATAREAAGVVHSDMEHGFIRAEVVHWDRLLEAGSFAVAREKAWLRVEGKEYRVLDGDLIHFRHSG